MDTQEPTLAGLGIWGNSVNHVVIQWLSHVWLFVTPWTAAHSASLPFTISQSLLKLTSIESVIPSNLSSSATPFCSCLQSFQASGSFSMSQFFIQGGQSIGASASTSVLPINIDWFPLGLTPLISLLSKWLSRGFLSTTVQKHKLLGTLPSLWSKFLIHTWLLEKP